MKSQNQFAPVARRRQWNFGKATTQVFAGSSLDSYLMMGLSLLFPSGERAFIKAVRNQQHLAATQAEREAVKNFIAQEASHTNAHVVFNQQIKQFGIDTETFQNIFETLFNKYGEDLYSNLFGENFRLAFTAASEHFTATWAADFLRSGKLEGISDPEVRRLLSWHAWEEMEHRSVAFDLWQKTGGSYALRIFAMFVTATYMGFLLAGSTAYFAANDKNFDLPKFIKEVVRDLTNASGFSWTWLSVKTVFTYLAPGFHPEK